MAVEATPRLLRKLGNTERYSSVRHHLGIYRCVTVTCRYRLPTSINSTGDNNTISPGFYAALSKVVQAQPMLHVGITAEGSNNDVHFTHVPQLDLRDHVVVRPELECASRAEYEVQLGELHRWQHDQLWEDTAARPPWRIAILRPPSSGDDALQELQGQVDVSFAFHHSLMDGSSGRSFHEMLLAALIEEHQRPSSSSNPEGYKLTFPTLPTLPEPEEQVINFTLSIPYTLGILWDEFGPSWLKPKKTPIWSGKDIDFSLPYITRVHAFDISSDVLASLLKACRANATTLQGLFHSLVLASFAAHFPATEALAFSGSTPINLRPFMSSSADPAFASSLRLLVTGLSHEFPPEAVAALREPGADTTALIWKTAAKVKTQLDAKLKSIPNDDIIGMQKYISNWAEFFSKKDGQKRSESWEISNIGVLRNPEDAAAGPSISRLMFTNSAMVAGAPVGVNVGSVAGSNLTVAISWQDTVVSDELIQTLAADLSGFVTRFYETGKFTI